MQTLKTFSADVTVPSKTQKFDFAPLADGKIYKTVEGTDYQTSTKGFVVSMTRWANSNNVTVERLIAPDGKSVEFRLTVNPAPETPEAGN